LKKQDRTYFHFLEDILLSMQRIQEYVSGYDFKKFKQDYKTVDAVMRNLEIIGEAAKNLPDKIKKQYTEVPWEEMYRLRNRVTHEYFGVDYDIIWDIVTNYLPENEKAIIHLLENEKGPKPLLD
jgi:uncharacterized protein with HEPN domain